MHFYDPRKCDIDKRFYYGHRTYNYHSYILLYEVFDMGLTALKFTLKLIEHKYCATETVLCYGWATRNDANTILIDYWRSVFICELRDGLLAQVHIIPTICADFNY